MVFLLYKNSIGDLRCKTYFIIIVVFLFSYLFLLTNFKNNIFSLGIVIKMTLFSIMLFRSLTLLSIENQTLKYFVVLKNKLYFLLNKK